MGLYIEKTELPKGGNETIIRILPNGEILDQYGHHLGVSALPVPPHGRLIDADELINNTDIVSEWGDESGCSEEKINDAPTIIPPEK